MPAQDQLYDEAVGECGPALRRLAMAYEMDPDRRRDLLQDVHVALWRSLASFDGRCSLRTWVYRVAHNVGATYVLRQRRANAPLVDLETLQQEPAAVDGLAGAERQDAASRLLDRIRRLKPLERQIMLLYLEGEPAGIISETTGVTPSAVAVKIHRLKKLLAHEFAQGGGVCDSR